MLLVVADAANADGKHAHPGTDNVAEFSLYSRRQAIHLLSELVADEWLEVTETGGGRGQATVYRIIMERVQPPHEPNPGNGAATPTETVQSDPLKGAVSDETVQPRLHPNGLTTEPPTENTNGQAEHLAEAFDAFWVIYPRKIEKATAAKAWPKAVKAAGGTQVILEGARRYAEECARAKREAQYVKHPGPWLNAERWNDEPEAGARRPGDRPIMPNDGRDESESGRIFL